jgi:hypothetical protein
MFRTSSGVGCEVVELKFFVVGCFISFEPEDWLEFSMDESDDDDGELLPKESLFETGCELLFFNPTELDDRWLLLENSEIDANEKCAFVLAFGSLGGGLNKLTRENDVNIDVSSNFLGIVYCKRFPIK